MLEQMIKQEHRRPLAKYHKIPITSLEIGECFAVVVGQYMAMFMVTGFSEVEEKYDWVQFSSLPAAGESVENKKKKIILARNIDTLDEEVFTKKGMKVRRYYPTEEERIGLVPFIAAEG